MISVIIPTIKGREELLNKLLASLPEDVETIIVDDEDLLLAAKRNKGAKKATGEYLFFIDDDNYLKDFALVKMLEQFDETIGVMGMTACYQDKKMRIADGGSLRNMITGFTKGLRTNESVWDIYDYGDELYDVDEVANAFMIRRDVFEEAGGFDEENFPIDLDEADLCKRIKNMGYRVVMNPKAICYHKSITYNGIPNFRRCQSAYFLSRNIIFYQRKHLNALPYCVFIIFFLPIRICFYLFALVWNKNIQMIPSMMKGYLDGLRSKKENSYQRIAAALTER